MATSILANYNTIITMLYYFSGTGNSKLVCSMVAELLDEKSCPITAPLHTCDYSIGIVFPVYAWGMPRIVKNFVEQTLSELITTDKHYVYAIMTCGDDIGYTDSLIKNALSRSNITLSAAFSVQMPNTYVALPGFDIDSPELAQSKIDKMQKLVTRIAATISKHSKVTWVTRGSWAWVKSYVIRPLFMKLLINDEKFRAEERCIHCRKCAAACPVNNIRMVSKQPNNTFPLPSWQHHCEGCFACYHVCPCNAIQYGRFTKGKGQKKLPTK